MPRLTAEKVIDGALELADEIGIDALTIRRLADHIDAKPMTIYHHLPNKDAIIDGMIDRVFGEIDLPQDGEPWRSATTRRAHSAREVLARHPWATPLLDSRTGPGPLTLRHHEAVTGCFRNAGFSIAMVGHAAALIDAFVYGFALQEAALPATTSEEISAIVEDVVMPLDPGTYPNLVEFAKEQVLNADWDFGKEFDFGLELILDGIEGRL